MSIANNKFYVNSKNALGLEFQAYLQNIRSLSLQQPGKYFKLRSDLDNHLKGRVIEELYNILFAALCQGTDPSNNPIGQILGTPGFVPSYPSNLINQRIMGILNGLTREIDSVIEIILPMNLNALSESNYALQAKTSQFVRPQV